MSNHNHFTIFVVLIRNTFLVYEPFQNAQKVGNKRKQSEQEGWLPPTKRVSAAKIN